MCDEFTEAENRKWLSHRPIGRRTFGLGGASVAAVGFLPGCAEAGSPNAPAIRSRNVVIETADGKADCFFVCPYEGTHPAIIMWPDIAGLREAYVKMGSRLAQSGYAVLVVNQYYRSAPAPVLETLDQWRTEEGQAKLKPMIAAISPGGTARDASSFVGWLGAQVEVDQKRKVGTCGYCMGGPFTFRTAAAAPERVGALGSFHGGGLVTDGEDSPHLLIPKMKAAMLVAIAQNDDARDPETKTILRETANEAGRAAKIEVYPAQHGWCTIDAPVYDGEQAEKAWGRMLALFSEHL